MRKTSLLCWAALVVGFAAGPAVATPACQASGDAGVAEHLAHVAEALKPGATLNVLAVGSATLFGPEASLVQPSPQAGASASSTAGQMFTGEASELAFPRQMGKMLETAVPGLKVQVTVRGGHGLTAADMLTVIRAALAEHPYQLVIWQTGTVEAVRNRAPGEFGQVLAEGAEAVVNAGADLVLVDPQYSRFLQTNSNLDPYEQAFAQAASMPGVALFHRFDLMRNWANDGAIDLERTPKSQRHRVAEELHACLGTQLARLVLSGSRS